MCNKLSSELIELADKAEEELSNGKSTEQLYIKMKELWSSKKNSAEMFINHNDADSIDNLRH